MFGAKNQMIQGIDIFLRMDLLHLQITKWKHSYDCVEVDKNIPEDA